MAQSGKTKNSDSVGRIERCCIIDTCRNIEAKTKIHDKDVTYHIFPKYDEELRKKWLQFCRKESAPELCWICSLHFRVNDYEVDTASELEGVKKWTLKNGVVPSIYTPISKQTLAIKKITPDEIESLISGNSAVIQEIRRKLKEENEDLKKKYIFQKKLNDRLNSERKSLMNHELPANDELTEEAIEKKFRSKLLQIFTETQTDILLNKKKRVIWDFEDIEQALNIAYLSQDTYLYLQNQLNYPLPSFQTLSKWAGHLNLRQGISSEILMLMNLYGKSKPAKDLATILIFDEIKIKYLYEYDKRTDEIIGPHQRMLIVMARSLFSTWKQIIYIGFDCRITESWLNEICGSLLNINYDPCAIVFKRYRGTHMLWKEFDINLKRYYFYHPNKDEKIYIFHDTTESLKILRNWFLDFGVIVQNTLKTKDDLLDLIDYDQDGCLKRSYIDCKGKERDYISLATDLFSSKIALALRTYKKDYILADFFDTVSDWYNLMNTTNPDEIYLNNKLYSFDFESQNQILDGIYKSLKSVRHPNRFGLQIYQKAILTTISSLKDLYIDMKLKYDIDFIPTCKLNQIPLKQLLNDVKMLGYHQSYANTTPLNLINRIRMIILGKIQIINDIDEDDLSRILDNSRNGEILMNIELLEQPKEFLETNLDRNCLKEYFITTMIFHEAAIEPILDDFSEKLIDDPDFDEIDSGNKELTLNDGVRHLMEWIVKRYYHLYPKPSTWWIEKVDILENYFKDFHKLSIERNCPIKNLTRILKNSSNGIPDDIIETFVKQRTWIRIKHLNYILLKSENRLKSIKRKLNKV